MDEGWLRDRPQRTLARYVGHMEQLAGIRLAEGADGPAQGCRILHVWTGSGLAFDVLADRAMDIHACRYRGVPLAWISPLGVVSPTFYEPKGMGWLRTYGGGLFVTGGLDHFGSPHDYPRESIGQHGRVANLPAQSVNYQSYWSGEQYVLEIAGQVRQTRLGGENLLLERRISTALGSNRICIEDVVTNRGSVPQRHMYVYHFNVGFPIVSEASRLHLAVRETLPHDDVSASGLDAWQRFQPPTAGFQEQNFWHTPMANAAGRVRVTLESPLVGLALRWTYDATWLPYLLEWKMMGEGAYVVGIEPCNCRGASGPRAPADSAELLHLAPGEGRRYQMEVEVAMLDEAKEQ